MDKFTKEEKQLIINNAKEVIKYLQTEIVPKLRTDMSFRFKTEPGKQDLRLNIYTKMNDPIQLCTSHDYTFNPDSLLARNDSFNYFYYTENAKIMMILLENWKNTKEILLEQIEKDNASINLIHSFTV